MRLTFAGTRLRAPLNTAANAHPKGKDHARRLLDLILAPDESPTPAPRVFAVSAHLRASLGDR
ncbi:hypothetical protein GCM10010182_62370 [Actinomadura cremea]|nr:hypothetical protein GCM10010182_62370 [Actinomadura cremea]